ncbi:MoxR-like ATPase [Thermogutta terrifontis]|jgi:MoxR-like ATPase|uniref:MoxR-like ATPase n=1 Tax=Thermogutta terrifontis TaxID=1331910 RepID=A0A286RHL0_9BACT|nr:MoxR family ATPase [Thermogutta terrifontis]ASV75448.1 MoxR-like ATPase [Thermogutta terrifontis]
MDNETFRLLQALRDNINGVLLGKQSVVEMCLIALLAGEHLLLEDVPGVGKTLLGKAIARSIAGVFRRIQFTPDLLPSDITGSNLYHADRREFVFYPGPIFANVVLADEINRATPRTQSALLEAMNEAQVTVEGKTYPLPRPFLVIATQNPLEFEGTYPLPESQMDRFLLRISVGYPARDFERELLEQHRNGEPVDSLEPVLTTEQVLALQAAVREVRMERSVLEYLLDLVEATRKCPEIRVGASVRASLVLYRAAQARAFLEGRDFVVPDDIQALAVPVLAHRVITQGYLHGGQRDAVEALIRRLVEDTPVPA